MAGLAEITRLTFAHLSWGVQGWSPFLRKPICWSGERRPTPCSEAGSRWRFCRSGAAQNPTRGVILVSQLPTFDPVTASRGASVQPQHEPSPDSRTTDWHENSPSCSAGVAYPAVSPSGFGWRETPVPLP